MLTSSSLERAEADSSPRQITGSSVDDRHVLSSTLMEPGGFYPELDISLSPISTTTTSPEPLCTAKTCEAGSAPPTGT